MSDDLIPVDIEPEDVAGALEHLRAIADAVRASGRVDAMVQVELREAAAWQVGAEVRPMVTLAVAGYLVAAAEQLVADRVDGVDGREFTDAAFALVRSRLLG